MQRLISPAADSVNAVACSTNPSLHKDVVFNTKEAKWICPQTYHLLFGFMADFSAGGFRSVRWIPLSFVNMTFLNSQRKDHIRQAKKVDAIYRHWFNREHEPVCLYHQGEHQWADLLPSWSNSSPVAYHETYGQLAVLWRAFEANVDRDKFCPTNWRTNSDYRGYKLLWCQILPWLKILL